MPWLSPVASGPNALGDLSGQYWNVAQSNLRTQEGDIARRNAAEQGWNRWQSNVADLQNQQEAEQYRRDQIGRGETRRQFEWGADQRNKASEFGLKRAQIQRALDDEKLAEGDEVNAIEFVKQRVSETGDAFDQVTKRLESSKRAFDERFNEAQRKLPAGLVKFDRATGSYTLDPMALGGKTEVEKAELNAKVAKVNEELTGRFSEYNLAQQEHKTVSDLFNQAQQQLPRGAQVGKQNGKWVINSPTLRKTFSWEAPAVPRATDVTPPPPGRPSIARPQTRAEYDAVPDGTLVQIGGQIVPKRSRTSTATATGWTPIAPTAPSVAPSATSDRPISTQAEYSSLPSGARFQWVYPDGRRRAGVKP